jgi:hypothetical protein
MKSSLALKSICAYSPIVLVIVVIIIYITIESRGLDGAAGIGFLKKNKGEIETLVQTSKKYIAGQLDGMDSHQNVKLVHSSIFSKMIDTAKNHPRKRKMIDLTKDPATNSMQVLINTWYNGSFSPVHKHTDYSEVLVNTL